MSIENLTSTTSTPSTANARITAWQRIRQYLFIKNWRNQQKSGKKGVLGATKPTASALGDGTLTQGSQQHETPPTIPKWVLHMGGLEQEVLTAIILAGKAGINSLELRKIAPLSLYNCIHRLRQMQIPIETQRTSVVDDGGQRHVNVAVYTYGGEA